jgi:transposase
MDLSRAVYSRDLKIAAMRALDAGATGGEIARRYQVSPKLLERWRGEWRAKGELAFPGIGRRGVDLPAVDDARRIAELERKVGQMTMENDFLKKALQHFRDHHPPAVDITDLRNCERPYRSGCAGGFRHGHANGYGSHSGRNLGCQWGLLSAKLTSGPVPGGGQEGRFHYLCRGEHRFASGLVAHDRSGLEAWYSQRIGTGRSRGGVGFFARPLRDLGDGGGRRFPPFGNLLLDQQNEPG